MLHVESQYDRVDRHMCMLTCFYPLACMVHCSLARSARKLIVIEPHTLESFCRRLVAGVCVALWQNGSCGEEGRMFSLSDDIEHAVAMTISSCLKK